MPGTASRWIGVIALVLATLHTPVRTQGADNELRARLEAIEHDRDLVAEALGRLADRLDAVVELARRLGEKNQPSPRAAEPEQGTPWLWLLLAWNVLMTTLAVWLVWRARQLWRDVHREELFVLSEDLDEAPPEVDEARLAGESRGGSTA